MEVIKGSLGVRGIFLFVLLFFITLLSVVVIVIVLILVLDLAVVLAVVVISLCMALFGLLVLGFALFFFYIFRLPCISIRLATRRSVTGRRLFSTGGSFLRGLLFR